jgi:hypothetical protein
MGAARKIPRWAWVIGGLVVVMLVLTFTLERMFPESARIEDTGRTEIARATGHTVTTIRCEKILHIRSDIDLPCSVTLDDGTAFDTIAHVDAHYRYANHYSFTATFSPVPGQRGPVPKPTHTPYFQTPAKANKLSDCVSAAGTDPVKIQACTKGM